MKTDQHNISIEKLEFAAEMLKAMAHPMRMAMVAFIHDSEKTVTEIYEHLGVEQTTASQQLAVLKNKGIVLAKRDGKHVLYSLRNTKILQVIDCIQQCEPRPAWKN